MIRRWATVHKRGQRTRRVDEVVDQGSELTQEDLAKALGLVTWTICLDIPVRLNTSWPVLQDRPKGVNGDIATPRR